MNFDLFNLFRWLFFVFVTVYFLVTTIQFLWSWYVWLWQPDRYMSMLRRYLIVHGLRLRVRTFWGDFIICVLLFVAFILLWRAHIEIEAVARAMRSTGG
jgi:hypothetical protein